ncbi:hypothetical protein SAMN05444422_101469 [Halobiforma haloterrestris]|uniref:Uncharacterized protein n=1 Tax=Natronobacterium haloterrestre TaxID=148448 RepID=A0A1I1DHB4_NATHA|nr:hypothetical protein SAMN05444422_101469 [Halobiforma haloterrestris]
MVKTMSEKCNLCKELGYDRVCWCDDTEEDTREAGE